MSDFQKHPFVDVEYNAEVYIGWNDILSEMKSAISKIDKIKKIIILELYHGVFEDEVINKLSHGLRPNLLILSKNLYHTEDEIKEMVYPYVTDDRVFGHLSNLEIEAYFNNVKLERARAEISRIVEGTVLVAGIGAAVVSPECDLLIYAEMARWEIQTRMRKHEINNLGVKNKDVEDWALLYKQSYFVDWRVCDRLKKRILHKWDYVLDTNNRDEPKMVNAEAVREGLRQCLERPFSVVPFFDPGPWGGQWLKRICNLDRNEDNFAWCFNCVPEENSLLLRINKKIIELPSIDLVFFDSQKLLGEEVYNYFGDEFPIRFDFLDTMDGGNLSLQVHPLKEYIKEKFGMEYTQDESYYIMDAKLGAVVYLGLKEGIDQNEMLKKLEEAQEDKIKFDTEKFVQTWNVKKHDHFSIPAGTIHCSGKDCVVLEISATPYIFTFKLWDWGRLGLDGKPRPINIEHGKNVIQWNRTTNWTGKNLVNRIEKIDEGDGWVEERTGLHEKEFIETRRHWFKKGVLHNTNGGLNVLNLVEGKEAVVESLTGLFEPFVVHYAETFIVPASIGQYSIRPYGKSEGQVCATIKAYVRTNI